MYGQVCSMHLNLFAYVSVVLSFLYCKFPLVCVVLHSAGGATMIAIIMHQSWVKKVWRKSYFWGCTLQGFQGFLTGGLPRSQWCAYFRGYTPGGAGCPAPLSPSDLTPSARGGGCYILPVPAHSKMKIKRFWFCAIILCRLADCGFCCLLPRLQLQIASVKV